MLFLGVRDCGVWYVRVFSGHLSEVGGGGFEVRCRWEFRGYGGADARVELIWSGYDLGVCGGCVWW